MAALLFVLLFMLPFTVKAEEEQPPEEPAPASYAIAVITGYHLNGVQATGEGMYGYVANIDGTPVMETVTPVYAGTPVAITVNTAAIPPEYEFSNWIIVEGAPAMDVHSETPVFLMPESNVVVVLNLKENAAYAASQSEAESIRQSESESASEQESRSQAQAEAEAARLSETLEVDGYHIRTHVYDLNGPEGFILANDPQTFDQEVEAFYNTAYRTYAYYAEKNGEWRYYVYNQLRKTLIPLLLITGPDGSTYIANAPMRTNEIPGTYQSELLLDIVSQNGEVCSVPGFLVKDMEDNLVTLVCMTKEGGSRAFFVYDNQNGALMLTPWSEYEEKITGTSSPETEEPSIETQPSSETQSLPPLNSSVSPQTADDKASGESGFLNFVKDYAVWLIILLAILILIIIAIIVVRKMSRNQDAIEKRLDREEEEDYGDSSYTGSYNQKKVQDPEPFDIDFEDAFPDELQVRKKASPKTPVKKKADAASFEEETDDLQIRYDRELRRRAYEVEEEERREIERASEREEAAKRRIAARKAAEDARKAEEEAYRAYEKAEEERKLREEEEKRLQEEAFRKKQNRERFRSLLDEDDFEVIDFSQKKK